MEPKKPTRNEILGYSKARAIQLATAAKTNPEYRNQYYNDDLLYLHAKTYKLLPENHQKNFIKNNLTDIQKTELNNLITNSVVNSRNSLDNFITNRETFYRNNKNNNFIFNGAGAPEVKPYKGAVTIEELSDEDEELENELKKINAEELITSNNPFRGASSDEEPSTSKTPPPPTRPKLSSTSPKLSYDEIYNNYQIRKNQLNELVKNNPQHAGDSNNNDSFYLNAKTYLSLPDDAARDKFLKEGIGDYIVRNQIINAIGSGIAVDEKGQAHSVDRLARLKYSVLEREKVYNNLDKTKPFIFNPRMAPQPIEPYIPKPILKKPQPQPSPIPQSPRTTTPPPVSNKGQALPPEQIILDAYHREASKALGDKSRLEYLQLKTFSLLNDVSVEAGKDFLNDEMNEQVVGIDTINAIKRTPIYINNLKRTILPDMEKNDMHNGVYGDSPFNPLQPSSTFNLDGNNKFQQRTSDESDDDGNINRRASQIGEDYLRNWNTAPTNNSQQKSVDQRYKNQAERMVNQVSTYTNDAFEAARNNYFTPPPAPPAPPAGTPPPKKPTDPKDLYPLFTFSKYEGKVDPLNPNKKPSDINYTFKRQGESELDMNAKDAKSLTDHISKISFEKNNEAFIMTFKFKSAISNDSVAMTNMINELHKIKGLSSHYNNITMELTLTFSSKAMVAKLLGELQNNNKDKDGKLEQKEFKELYGNFFKKFSANEQVANLLKQEYKIIDDAAKLALERDLNITDNTKPKGLLARIIDNIMPRNINPQQKRMIEMNGKQAISANHQERVGIHKRLVELNLFKNVLLNGSGPRGTNFDSILKEALIEKVAAGIFDKFGEIFGVVGKHGLKMNEANIKNFVRGELESHNKSSIDPMIAYANDKVTLDDLRAVKTIILREIDEQIEKEKEKLGKNLAERSEIPLQLAQIMEQMQAQARTGGLGGSGVPSRL